MNEEKRKGRILEDVVEKSRIAVEYRRLVS